MANTYVDKRTGPSVPATAEFPVKTPPPGPVSKAEIEAATKRTEAGTKASDNKWVFAPKCDGKMHPLKVKHTIVRKNFQEPIELLVGTAYGTNDISVALEVYVKPNLAMLVKGDEDALKAELKNRQDRSAAVREEAKKLKSVADILKGVI